jgi:RNA polymerase sigma-70 factor (ECF subfamily)
MEQMPPPASDPVPEAEPLSGTEISFESTHFLLQGVQRGDSQALDRLCQRYLPRLRRWATGRLPAKARGFMDTDDLVQDTLIRALRRFPDFELRHEGALQAYLRHAVFNMIREQARRVRSRPEAAELDGEERDPGPSPLEQAVGRELADRYEAAFNRLRPEDQQAIVARCEMGFSYKEVAEALKKPSPDAARMAVSRALLNLAREMHV